MTPASKATDPNWLSYDLDSLVGNLAEVRQRVGREKAVFAAVKGNAYGHGVLPIARALERAGVSAFMTGAYDEAELLRQHGIKAPIIMFAAALPEGIPRLMEAGLVPTILDRAGAEAAAAAGSVATPGRIYVKLDLGLGRLGVPLEDAETFLAALQRMPTLKVEGLYTHLPFGDEAGRDWAGGRHAAFDDLLGRLEAQALLPPVTQAGASSSVLTGLKDRANTVCVGHALFGFSPFADASLGNCDRFKPVLREIGSRLVQVSLHRQGSDLAIAGLYGIRKPKRIGVAPVGAAHGLQRPLPGTNPWALVRGQRVPILAVSLEHLSLDLDRVEDAEVGDQVLILGRDGEAAIGLDEVAGWSGLSCLDLALAVSGRMTAHYRDDS